MKDQIKIIPHAELTVEIGDHKDFEPKAVQLETPLGEFTAVCANWPGFYPTFLVSLEEVQTRLQLYSSVKETK